VSSNTRREESEASKDGNFTGDLRKSEYTVILRESMPDLLLTPNLLIISLKLT
jgi:hypothetical protein